MRDNKDSSGPLPKQAAVPTTKSQVPAVRSGVPITLDKHAAVTEATAELATLLGHFGGKKWSAWNEKYHTARPTREHIAAVRALLPSVPRVQEQWAEAYQPTSADFLVAEMGMVAEGMPLANNINPKVFLQNLVDNLRRQDPPPTMWEVREARIAFVGKAHFADVAGFLEIFAEKREEAKYISKILKPGFIEHRLKTAEQLEKRYKENLEERGITELEYGEMLLGLERGEPLPKKFTDLLQPCDGPSKKKGGPKR